MDVTLMQVRAFLSVAKCGTFTQAAHVLHISQPALSVQVRQLEESLNLRLFDRDTRHVALTHSGNELLPIFQRLFMEFETVIANARDLSAKKQGVVRLACVPSIATTYLPEAIAQFRKRHPNISIDLRDAHGKRVVSLVRSDDVELGITNASFNPEEIDSLDLYQEKIHVVFPKSHPIGRLEQVTIEQIATYPLVLLSPELNSRTILDAAFSEAGLMVNPAIEVTHPSTAIGMVRAGIGVALLGSLVINASNVHAYPELVSRAIKNPHLHLRIRLIWKMGCSFSPPAQAFVKLLRELNKENRWLPAPSMDEDRGVLQSCD
ncbi:MAG TPA: LysR family transcriptional regulator [Candidatus Acidoferrum sp.]|jgi:DNA-binding transcriptional LysR family regulator|nr:LysR family transcriptional regulator [Candidatus Acidoferrum sp.]